MNPQQIEEILSGRRTDLTAKSLRCLTALAEPLYWLGLKFHQGLYRSKIKSSYQLDCPVISIGNLTTGGTGKTPLSIALLKLLQDLGHRPGHVSRGYRALDENEGVALNDEGKILERLSPETPSRQMKDRVKAAQELLEEGINVVLIDDGFQHLRLQRNLDIVLIDAVQPFGCNHLLPRGFLREPISAIQRADVVIITRVDLVEQVEVHRIEKRIRQIKTLPILQVRFRPSGWLTAAGEVLPLDQTPSSAVGFCGIGNPGSFRALLEQVGCSISDEDWHPFPDHHHYTTEDLAALVERSNAHPEGVLVTTLKDMVKIDEQISGQVKCLALLIETEFLSGEQELRSILKKLIS